MKRYGFTLVELMGVIIILGVIALIAIPIVDRQLKESKNDLHQTQKENIKEAAKLWTAKNVYNLPTSGACYLRYSELVSSGFLDEELKDPKTNTTFTDENINIKIEKDTDYNKYTYDVTSTKDDSIPYCQITVSFYDGETKLDSKTVVYHSTYGELPTPTKEGYTFLGWHGKNMFNVGTLDDYYIRNQNTMLDIENNSISGIILKDAVSYVRNDSINYNSGTYLLQQKSSNNMSRHLVYAYDSSNNLLTNSNISISGWNYNSYYNGWYNSRQNITVTIPQQVSYWRYGMVFAGSSSIVGQRETKTNVQIERGSTVTEYEPYYITPSTTVVQPNNHTLTAVWQEIE